MLKKLRGRYAGPVAYDGRDFYAVKATSKGDVLTKTRLVSVGPGEWRYATKDDPSHHDANAVSVQPLEVGGE